MNPNKGDTESVEDDSEKESPDWDASEKESGDVGSRQTLPRICSKRVMTEARQMK